MRRVSAAVAVAAVMAAALMLVGAHLPLQAQEVAAQAAKKPSVVGSWSLTFTPSNGDQTHAGPVHAAFGRHTPRRGAAGRGGWPLAGCLRIAGCVRGIGHHGAFAEPDRGIAESQPAVDERKHRLQQPWPGVWTAAANNGFAFTYLVLQSDQAGNFVANVTVSGSAAPDENGKRTATTRCGSLAPTAWTSGRLREHSKAIRSLRTSSRCSMRHRGGGLCGSTSMTHPQEIRPAGNGTSAMARTVPGRIRHTFITSRVNTRSSC